MEDTILYAACFDANTGLFETILGPEDAVISDELNHASIIDGVRLCKAARYRYRNNDMDDLEAKLKEARDAGAQTHPHHHRWRFFYGWHDRRAWPPFAIWRMNMAPWFITMIVTPQVSWVIKGEGYMSTAV